VDFVTRCAVFDVRTSLNEF